MSDNNLYDDIMSEFGSSKKVVRKKTTTTTKTTKTVGSNGYEYDTEIPNLYMDDVPEEEIPKGKTSKPKKAKKKKQKKSEGIISKAFSGIGNMIGGIITLIVAIIFLYMVGNLCMNLFNHTDIQQDNLHIEDMFMG